MMQKTTIKMSTNAPQEQISGLQVDPALIVSWEQDDYCDSCGHLLQEPQSVFAMPGILNDEHVLIVRFSGANGEYERIIRRQNVPDSISLYDFFAPFEVTRKDDFEGDGILFESFQRLGNWLRS